jgi:hypothetical protein
MPDRRAAVGRGGFDRGMVLRKTLNLYEPSLWRTNYLIAGVVGSVT